jgi:hypothetical protein
VIQIAITAFINSAANGHKSERSIMWSDDGECSFVSKQEIQDHINTLYRTALGSAIAARFDTSRRYQRPRACLVILIARFKHIKLQGGAISSSDQTHFEYLQQYYLVCISDVALKVLN